MINTQDGWPKPGENVRVDIITSGNATVTSVPIVAITYEDNDPIVFVKKDDRHFEKRKIVIQEMHEYWIALQLAIQCHCNLYFSKVSLAIYRTWNGDYK